MTITQIEFSHKVKCISIDKYYFIVTTNRKQVSFYTFKDMSGYCIENALELPEEFVFIGTTILTNKDYIKELIKLNSQ